MQGAHHSQMGSADTVALGHHCIVGSEQRNRSCAQFIGSGEARALLDLQQPGMPSPTHQAF